MFVRDRIVESFAFGYRVRQATGRRQIQLAAERKHRTAQQVRPYCVDRAQFNLRTIPLRRGRSSWICTVHASALVAEPNRTATDQQKLDVLRSLSPKSYFFFFFFFFVFFF